jgi:hypothetical protein
MALRLTQTLTEMSTGIVCWGVKVGGSEDWQTCHLHVPIVWKSDPLNLLEPQGLVHVRLWDFYFYRVMEYYVIINLIEGETFVEVVFHL